MGIFDSLNPFKGSKSKIGQELEKHWNGIVILNNRIKPKALLCNNCFPYFYYKSKSGNFEYTTPTVDICIHPKEYLKLIGLIIYLNNLHLNLTKKNFSKIDMSDSKYGSEFYNNGLNRDESTYRDWLAVINYDHFHIELDFLHYNTFEEGVNKFIRRFNRLRLSNMILVASDCDGGWDRDSLSEFALKRFYYINDLGKKVVIPKIFINWYMDEAAKSTFDSVQFMDHLQLIKQDRIVNTYKIDTTVLLEYNIYKYHNGYKDENDYPPRYFKEDFDFDKLIKLAYEYSTKALV